MIVCECFFSQDLDPGYRIREVTEQELMEAKRTETERWLWPRGVVATWWPGGCGRGSSSKRSTKTVLQREAVKNEG